jgi:hypothetical protein
MNTVNRRCTYCRNSFLLIGMPVDPMPSKKTEILSPNDGNNERIPTVFMHFLSELRPKLSELRQKLSERTYTIQRVKRSPLLIYKKAVLKNLSTPDERGPTPQASAGVGKLSWKKAHCLWITFDPSRQ